MKYDTWNPNQEIWKTIKTGTGPKTADNFQQALGSNNFRLGGWAKDMLSQAAFTVATEKTDVDLGFRSVAELGFRGKAQYYRICGRIIDMGHELCLTEDGPQLRLQYPDQPLGEDLFMAMKAIRDSLGNPQIFRVGRGDHGLWLSSRYGNPTSFWFSENLFVFRLRKRLLAT